VVADDSIDGLRTSTALTSLERIFEQVAVEDDSAAVSQQIVQLIGA
jgi:hypothetical protein